MSEAWQRRRRRPRPPAPPQAAQDEPVRPAPHPGRGAARQRPRRPTRPRADAYGRLQQRQGAAKALIDDKKLQKDLKKAADALRDAGDALREGPKKRKRRGGLGRKLLLLAIVGAGLALALSEDLRNKVLDALFGAEEEFDYTSTTTPARRRRATARRRGLTSASGRTV